MTDGVVPIPPRGYDGERLRALWAGKIVFRVLAVDCHKVERVAPQLIVEGGATWLPPRREGIRMSGWNRDLEHLKKSIENPRIACGSGKYARGPDGRRGSWSRC